MANLSKQQVVEIIKNAPAGTTPSGIVASLRKSGHVLEGYPTDVVANEPKTIGGFLGNVLKSGGEFVMNTVDAVAHPIRTAKAIGSIALGGAEKLVPGEQGSEQNFDMLTGFFKDRYGSVDKIKETLYRDPVGFATDLATVFSGGGAIATKVGTAGKVAEFANITSKAERIAAITKAAEAGELGQLAQFGVKLSKAGEVIDPIAGTFKLTGKALQNASEGRGIAPFAGSVDREAVEAAQRQGVQLPASALSDSKVVPLIEKTAEKSLIGGGKITEMVEQAGTRLNQVADDLVRVTGESPDMTAVGKKIQTGFQKYQDDFDTLSGQLYDAFDEKLGNPTASFEKTKQALESIIRQKKKSLDPKAAQEVAYYEKALANITKKQGGTATRESAILGADGKPIPVEVTTPNTAKFNNLKQTRTDVGRQLKNRLDPFTTGDKANLEAVYAALSEDMNRTVNAIDPALGSELEKATNFFREGLEKMNSAYGKKIAQFADQPDKILPAIISPSTSVEDIPRIYEVIGKENVPAVQSAFLDNFFKDARGTSDIFQPTGITRQINKYGDETLKAVLTPEQYKVVKDLETLSKSLGKGSKIGEGSQTAFLAKTAAIFGSTFANPVLAFKLFVGDALFNKFITSSAGQKFLTEGLELTGETGRKVEAFGVKARRAIVPAFQAGRAASEQ
jgi:hypothetical protein